MKPNELQFGNFRSGPFMIYVGPIAFDSRPADQADFFSIMVSQPVKGENPPSYYINLVEDLGWFSWMAKFERPLRAEEITEYNYYLTIKGSLMPVWKLSRHSVIELLELCRKAKRKY